MMNKIWKLCLIGISVFMILLISGCGSDKFSGKWITPDKDGRVSELKIEKNGDGKGYILSETDYYYDEKKSIQNEKEYNAYTSINPFKRVKLEPVIPIYDFTFIWKSDTDKMTALEQDNRLVIDGNPFMIYSYIEKDGSLQIQDTVYKKEGESDLDNIKKNIQDNITKTYNEKFEKLSQHKEPAFRSKLGNITFVDDVENAK